MSIYGGGEIQSFFREIRAVLIISPMSSAHLAEQYTIYKGRNFWGFGKKI